MPRIAFDDRIEKDTVTKCHNWNGPMSRDGYGVFAYQGKSTSVHRFAYERRKGKIPKGLTIDHLCRNTRCCNPDHLEAVSVKENVLRGTSFSAINAKKTHCKNGHIFDEKNTYFRKGWRQCRKCNVISVRKYKRRGS